VVLHSHRREGTTILSVNGITGANLEGEGHNLKNEPWNIENGEGGRDTKNFINQKLKKKL